MANNLTTKLNFIEQLAWWEGQINASHLMEKFNISRQSASHAIKKYKELNPNNLIYNASLKAYLPSQTFNANNKVLDFSQYLNAISSKNQPIQIHHLTTETTNIYEVQAPLRHIDPLQVRPILKAIREKLAVDIGYISLSSPDYLDRIIQPHALIFDGLRWH